MPEIRDWKWSWIAARVVCISRETGADGEAVGRAVAERLGLQYVDEEVIARAAERGGVDEEQLADAEQRKSRIRRVIELLTDAGTAARRARRRAGVHPGGARGGAASADPGRDRRDRGRGERGDRGARGVDGARGGGGHPARPRHRLTRGARQAAGRDRGDRERGRGAPHHGERPGARRLLPRISTASDRSCRRTTTWSSTPTCSAPSRPPRSSCTQLSSSPDRAQVCDARGSNASRSPSPSRLNPSVVASTARPGQTIRSGRVV